MTSHFRPPSSLTWTIATVSKWATHLHGTPPTSYLTCPLSSLRVTNGCIQNSNIVMLLSTMAFHCLQLRGVEYLQGLTELTPAYLPNVAASSLTTPVCSPNPHPAQLSTVQASILQCCAQVFQLHRALSPLSLSCFRITSSS